MDIPRALNDPVGFRASSLIQVEASARIRGVHPSVSETAASGRIGSTPRYLHSDDNDRSITESGSVSGFNLMFTRRGSPQLSQVVWSRPSSW